MDQQLIDFLVKKAAQYNRPSFIKDDPVSVPHRFTKKQDIEIAAFFAAIFAWGNRTTIIKKATELMRLMDDAPYAFCTSHSDNDLKNLTRFRHRTFNDTDLLYFIAFLKHHYLANESLETAFVYSMSSADADTGNALRGFYSYFFSLEDVPQRTKKHIATPARKSTCKRLSMFLRWMVRQDKCGVDFGLWHNISPSQLVLPMDLHVARVARHFKIIERKQTDWQAALDLTAQMKLIDADDPCRFDFALFALGVLEKF